MTTNSKIEWTDHTVNFWWGCNKVSPGCANCYAETFSKRVGNDIWGKGAPRRWIKSAASEARKLNMQAERLGVRYRVFSNSMSDFFESDEGQPIVDHNARTLYTINGGEFFTEGEYPDCRPATLTDLRNNAFEIIDECQNLDWILVTKRPENIPETWPQPMNNALSPYRMKRGNLILLTSVENQEQAEIRIPELLKCRDLCPVLGLSVEPMLRAVNLDGLFLTLDQTGANWNVLTGEFAEIGTPGYWFGDTESDRVTGSTANLDWIICGGESGHHARPFDLQWARSLKDQCASAGVPFFMKQFGSNPIQSPDYRYADQLAPGEYLRTAQILLRDPKGGDWDEWPASYDDLKVREFPET
jgi:protein gp37